MAVNKNISSKRGKAQMSCSGNVETMALFYVVCFRHDCGKLGFPATFCDTREPLWSDELRSHGSPIWALQKSLFSTTMISCASCR